MLAMLIDLDRSQPVEENLAALHYKPSVMYSVPSAEKEEKWTCGMLDWRQLPS